MLADHLRRPPWFIARQPAVRPPAVEGGLTGGKSRDARLTSCPSGIDGGWRCIGAPRHPPDPLASSDRWWERGRAWIRTAEHGFGIWSPRYGQSLMALMRAPSLRALATALLMSCGSSNVGHPANRSPSTPLLPAASPVTVIRRPLRQAPLVRQRIHSDRQRRPFRLAFRRGQRARRDHIPHDADGIRELVLPPAGPHRCQRDGGEFARESVPGYRSLPTSRSQPWQSRSLRRSRRRAMRAPRRAPRQQQAPRPS